MRVRKLGQAASLTLTLAAIGFALTFQAAQAADQGSNPPAGWTPPAGSQVPPDIEKDWPRGVWQNVDSNDFLSDYPGGGASYYDPKIHWRNPPPYTPEALARYNKIREEAFAGHDLTFTGNCLPEGTPYINGWGLMDIFFKPGEVVMLHEDLSGTRRIFMWRHEHPKGDQLDYMFQGDSLGHWEGKTLVIDTVGFRDDTFFEIGMPMDHDLHLIERWTQTGPDALEVKETLIDPKIFTKPWHKTWHWHRTDKWIEEAVCVPKDSPYTTINGVEVLLGKDGKPLPGQLGPDGKPLMTPIKPAPQAPKQ
jgi:hypothetical protein